MIPAAVTGAVTLVLPSVQTFIQSFRTGSSSSGPGGYSTVFAHAQFWKALGFSLSLGVIPLVVAIVVAPLLAAAVHGGGTWMRRIGLVVMSVPVVVFSPVAIAAGWLVSGIPGHGIWPAPSAQSYSKAAPWVLRSVTGLGAFGAVCGLGLLVFLAVRRGRGQAGSRRTFTAVAGIMVLAIAAASMQVFSAPAVLTEGGPGQSTVTPVFMVYEGLTRTLALSGKLGDPGIAAAPATVLGVLLALLGAAAVVIAIRTRLCLDLAAAPGDAKPQRHSPGGVVLAVAALVVVLAATYITMRPWLAHVFTSSPPAARTTLSQIYLNTWLPPLIGAAISVGTAYLAAVGIGGLRPLGRHSEWLLLLAAPWLFTGIGPLSVAGSQNVMSLHLFNNSVALIPPILLSVPALAVLTFFCRGRAERWRVELDAGAPAAGSFLGTVAGPAIPLAVLLGGLTTLLGAQDLLWPSLISFDPDQATAPLQLVERVLSSFKTDVGLTTPLLIVAVGFVVLAVLQVTFLEKIVIRRSEPEQPQRQA